MKLLARILLAILLFAVLALLFSGCKFYTKESAIKKFCSQDTVFTTITVRDTVVVDRITSDTVFSTSVDSVVVEKDRLVIRYQKIKDKIYLSGEYKGDTIYKDKVIQVKLPCNCRNASSYSLSEWLEGKGTVYKYLLLAAALGVLVIIVWLCRKNNTCVLI